jgi:hypothetical protein
MATGLDDAKHLWWERHVQPITNVVCCRASDGHVLGDNDWRTIEKPNEARAYRVHVGASGTMCLILALQPLVPSDYSMVMAKSRENRLTFATWLMFFRATVGCHAGHPRRDRLR